MSDLLRLRLRGRPIHALKGVDLQVAPGEIVGLLGSNGAGKSTLLRLIAGLLSPDEGQLRILGHAHQGEGDMLRRRVCYVLSEERSFSWRITGVANLEFFAALHGMGRAEGRQRVAEVLTQVGLEGDGDRTVREYSSGMRQRLALARGLLGNPDIFLFDEPTKGVDPKRARGLRRFIGEQLLQGRTAVVATHDFVEVEQLCQRVVHLEDGRIVAGGAPQEARGLWGLE